jgi:multiple sugar transport system substrate-binding protein
MSKSWKKHLVCVAVMFSMILSGCALGDSNAVQPVPEDMAEPEVSTEPVTLTLFAQVPLTREEFEKYLETPIKKKHPNITLEFIQTGDQKLDDLIGAHSVPDIIYAGPDLHVKLLDADIPFNLSGLIKEHKLPMSLFQPEIMDGIKQFGPKGEMYALPFLRNTVLLWYNKSIFDKFGVPYPKDGMTWGEALELARRMTRNVGGTQYRGLDPYVNGIEYFASPLSLSTIDPKSEKAFISEKWRDVFQLAMNFYNVPGNKPDKLDKKTTKFLQDQNVAMLPQWLNRMITDLENAKPSGFDWDVIQLPSFENDPNTGSQVDWHQLVISKTSEHKEQAFQVLEVAVSEEVQLSASKAGRIPVVHDTAIIQPFASELSIAKGKNMQSAFKGNPAKRAQMHKYSPIVDKEIEAAFKDVFDGNADIATALRQTEDRANAAIAAEKQK